MTHSLKSTKLSETDPPAPTYEEDPTLAPGTEKVKSNGSKGSKWETRLIVAKNGEVVSQDVDHSVTYKGHTPVILRNSTGTTAAGTTMEGDSSVASSAELTGETTVAENHKTSESATTAASHGAAADKTTAADKITAAETTAAAATTASQQPVSHPTAADSGNSAGNASTAENSGNAPTIAPNPGV